MPIHMCKYQLPEGDRIFKRVSLIEQFLREVPGTGRGPLASKYQYDVEAYGSYTIYLRRPTQLNKGFDFTVNIGGVYFKNALAYRDLYYNQKYRRYSNPSHQNIFDALFYCKCNYPNEYGKVKRAITEIYQCHDVDISEIRASFCGCEGTEHPIQIILLAVKWLFMEQDCAYWNYSGRGMLLNALLERELV